MITKKSASIVSSWQQQAQEYLQEEKYSQAANVYEQAIENKPEVKSYYWHLGLLYLLQEQEAEAQMVWLMAMAEGEPEEVEKWTEELVEILVTEAVRREKIKDEQIAWTLRQHIREISPDDLDNLLGLVILSLSLNLLGEDESIVVQIIETIKSKQSGPVNTDLLLQVLTQLLAQQPLNTYTFKLAEACVAVSKKNPHFSQQLTKLLFETTDLLVKKTPLEIAFQFAELCWRLQPNNIAILAILTNLSQNQGKYLESLKFARRQLKCAQEKIDKIAAYYLIVRGLMRAGGHWQEAQTNYQYFQQQVDKLIEQNTAVSEQHLLNLMITVPFFNYLSDNPEATHKFRNKLANYCQAGLEKLYPEQVKQFQQQRLDKQSQSPHKKLKIAYLSGYLYEHSVGWLARWLFQHHDRDRFTVYAYSLNKYNDSVQQFITRNSDYFRDLSAHNQVINIAECIAQDEIDILVDLDSVTENYVCGVMALKPAPIQITWLGSDASGLSTVDYFMADPYVLPASAPDYYAAKIWRLPQTYLAVDGFEVGVPTLRREQLGIPDDATIYLSAQSGYKRDPDTAKLQIQILKAVPNSYLLIKGMSDEESIKNFFVEIAAAENVDINRLCFLPRDPSELVHRANLSMADVVLDTYPYNGATTTLETLWMGIPLVTKVGEQFSARNSYTMLVNAGIEAGIAWTNEEYLEWGIRLGTDYQLRQKIAGQLRKSRQTAPLWNAKRFTQQMEAAYQQMWLKYIQ